jgi:uncharacterized protein DUF6152
MKRKMLLLFFAGAVLLFATMSYSHHSLAATYNSTAEIKLEGKLVQFVFRNPHSFVHLETRNANGEAERWAVEWTGVAALTRSGVQGDTLKPGDQVVITARPSRISGEARALMLSLWRPSDNFKWGGGRQGEVVD